jgi:hypothetical protein
VSVSTGWPGLSMFDMATSPSASQPVILFDAPPLPGATRWLVAHLQETRPELRVIRFPAADLVAAAYAGVFEDLSPYQSYVVWFEDLSPAGLALLDTEVVDIVSEQATIAANVAPAWCMRLEHDTTRVTAGARNVLRNRVHRVSLPHDLSADERRRAHALFPELKLSVDAAETMIGGRRLLARYDQSRQEQLAGRLLVEAAVDVRRAGVHRGLDPMELMDLYTAVAPPSLCTREHFDIAFRWATAVPPGCTVGLLVGRNDNTWTALSYVAAADDGEHRHQVRPLTTHGWDVVLRHTLPTDAFDIGIAAHLRASPEIARTALWRAARCHDAVLAARALSALDQLAR